MDSCKESKPFEVVDDLTDEFLSKGSKEVENTCKKSTFKSGLLEIESKIDKEGNLKMFEFSDCKIDNKR